MLREGMLSAPLHENDYQVTAEWHFIATSHSKGPCDGGGIIKRNALRVNLQRPLDRQITTPRKLFEWAQENIAGINVKFCSQTDILQHEASLSKRQQNAVTITGT